MSYDRLIEHIADAAINAGMFVRCCGYAVLVFCVAAPILVVLHEIR